MDSRLRTIISLVVISIMVSWSGEHWWGAQADRAQAGLLDGLLGGGGDTRNIPLPAVPAEYALKRMPPGYWTDPQVIEQGRKFTWGW